MKIVCLLKFIPDIENFTYDYDKNVLVRENVKLILNPEDACALALALKVKEKDATTELELVSMAPKSTVPLIEDLLRLNVDKATLLSDPCFAGSDTYVTSQILSKYLAQQEFDYIFTGTHTLDGDTAHIPSQVADLLSLSQLSNIIRVDEASLKNEGVVVEVECENTVSTYELERPCVLSIGRDSKYKLPFVKYKDLNLEVSDRITILTNAELGIPKEELGIEGSLTKVNRTYVKELQRKEKVVVGNDDEGIEIVYQFLRTKGFVK